MSTDLDPRMPTRVDAFVDKQISQVRDRIRRLDILRAVLCLGVFALGYGLVMVLLDIALQASYPGLVDAIHLGSFVLFLGVGGYFAVQVLARLSGRINPYYAAKQLEDSVPQAKNSVINWLDLREEKLPNAIHGAVSQRAARDLKRTDADTAVNPRSNWLLFSVLGVFLMGFLILLGTRPNQFSSLLQRAYAPFQGIAVNTRTTIELLQPEKGDVIVAPDRNVPIRARITGSYPGINKQGAPRMLFRYQQADPFVNVPLEEDTDGSWTIVRKPDQVRTGFFYKLMAGDAETPEYQVSVRTNPRATRFDVTYTYRPYLRLKNETVTFPNEKSLEPRIQARRGTEVTLAVTTNRKLKDSRIVLETGGEKLTFEGMLTKDGNGFETSWVMEKSGTFRVLFTSVDDEENNGATLYTIIVDDDKSPQVTLTEPAKDVDLPANGTLQLAGVASDDFGVRNLTLRLKVIAGAPKANLGSKAFREGKDFRFDDGSYPDRIEYMDVLALDAVTAVDGKPYPLKEKMVLEYWLEARDNADHPDMAGNVGMSKSYKIAILAPKKDEKQQKDERAKADKNQKDFEKKQDEKHSKENAKRNEDKSAESKDGKGEPKDGKGEPKDGAGKGKDSEEEKLKQKGAELARELEKSKKEQSPGDAKGEPSPASDNKDGDTSKGGAEPKSKDAKGAEPKEKAGEGKADGKDSNDKSPPAEAKDGGEKGKKDGGDSSAGKSRDAGKSDPPPADAKGGAEKKDGKSDDKGSAKAGGEKSDKKDNGAAAKEKGGGDGKIDPSSIKPGDHAKKDAPSTSKGSEDAGPKSASKSPGKEGSKSSDPGASAKEAGKKGMEKTETGSSSKNGERADKSEPSLSRGDGRKDERDRPKEITKEEIAKLREMLKDKDRAKEAAEELEKAVKEANDDKVKSAAKDALEDDGRQAGEPGRTKADKGEKKEPGETGTAKGSGGGDPKKTDAGETRDAKAGDEASVAKGTPKDKKGDHAKDLAKGESKAGTKGKGASGMSDADQKAIKAIEDFAKRGGDLQLDDLARYLKNVDAKTAERAGWSKEELRDWLKAAAKHDEQIAAERRLPTAKKKDAIKGGPGSLPAFGPRDVGTSTNPTSDPLVGGRPQPPPEFRDPQRIFTGRPKE